GASAGIRGRRPQALRVRAPPEGRGRSQRRGAVRYGRRAHRVQGARRAVLPVAGAVGKVSRAVLAAALVMLMAGAAAAQFGGGFGPRFVPAKFPTADTFGHGFVFCRGIFRSDRREAGGTGWSTDYPDA